MRGDSADTQNSLHYMSARSPHNILRTIFFDTHTYRVEHTRTKRDRSAVLGRPRAGTAKCDFEMVRERDNEGLRFSFLVFGERKRVIKAHALSLSDSA